VNETHWPKHVLVHYRWSEVAEVDSAAGLYVLFGLGARTNTCCARTLPMLLSRQHATQHGVPLTSMPDPSCVCAAQA
jgi:hypothetical protein